MHPKMEQFAEAGFIDRFLGMEEAESILPEPFHAEFVKTVEPLYVSYINTMLNGHPYDAQQMEQLWMMEVAGRGYRRTGNDLPAIKFFGSYFDENSEKPFMDLVMLQHNKILKQFLAAKKQTEMNTAAKNAINLAYFIKAVKDLPTNEMVKKTLNRLYASLKDGLKPIKLELITEIEL